MKIESMQNPKIKLIQRLKNKRDRDKQGLFLVEGYRECLRAKEANWIFDKIFYSKEHFLGENEFDLINSINAPAIEISKGIFSKISYRDRPDGMLGLVHMQKHTEEDLNCLLNKKENPYLVIAEAIEKPGNLGSILRSADATGCDGVIVANHCTDIYNPNVVRSSVGTLFTTPVFQLTNEQILPLMKKYGIELLAATPHTEHIYYEVDMTHPIGIIVGTEQIGLSNFWMQQATLQVKIPMLGMADSLNVANATTVLMYEVVRQRYSFSR